MLSIRLRRMGSKKKPYFRVVVTEARTYHPRAKPAQVNMNKERIQYWIKLGARPSDSVRTLIENHLTRDMSPAAEAASAPQ
jgi:small subunit ribosomal protein S16